MLRAGSLYKPLAIGMFLGILTTLGCTAGDEVSGSDSTPPWVVELIEGLEVEPMRNPPAFVARYSYLGNIVYYVPPFCCDMTSVLYDVEGEIICSPDGGITGGGDGRCSDFFEERGDALIVWEDSRAPGN